MFKFLKEKLKGVSKKLQDEVEHKLEDQLEKELAAAVAKETGQAPPAPPERTPTPAPAQPATESAKSAEPSPVQPPGVPSEAEAAQPKAAARGVVSVDSVDSVARPAPKPTAPVHDSGPKRDAERAERAEVGVSAGSASSVSAPAPKQVTGRKILSDAEISARLEAELREAVTTQKEVERVIESTASTGRFTINQDVLDDILWDLEVGLLESDVALPVIEAIKGNVRDQLLSLPVSGAKPEDLVEQVLRTAIKRVLSVAPMDFDKFVREKLAAGKRPVVVMFVGVNGTGKTTSIARIAHRLKGQGLGVVMAAGDTFRAGAIEQLALHGERLGLPVIKHKAGADPAAVAFDAIEHAKARKKEVVLLDTAGRMQNNSNLMDEMDKIRRVANPDLCIFVGDSLAGNDAVEQARRFDEVVDVGGVILTKVDVDAKGGAALSVAYTINKPLIFVGVGQDYGDLKPFDAGWLVDRLFGDEAEAEA